MMCTKEKLPNSLLSRHSPNWAFHVQPTANMAPGIAVIRTQGRDEFSYSWSASARDSSYITQHLGEKTRIWLRKIGHGSKSRAPSEHPNPH